MSVDTNRNLLVLIGDTHAVVDQTGIVAEQCVSRVLRDDTERDKDCETVSVTLGLHKVKVTAVLLILHFQTDSLLDLTVFKLNGGIVLVAIPVVVGKCAQRFLISLLGYQPTRRFRDPW
jgi:hypothetical protein